MNEFPIQNTQVFCWPLGFQRYECSVSIANWFLTKKHVKYRRKTKSKLSFITKSRQNIKISKIALKQPL